MRSTILLLPMLLISFAAAPQSPVQHQKAAQTAFTNEMAQEGKDCPNASTTYDENTCIGKVSEATEKHFKIFYQNLMSLLAVDVNNEAKLKEAQTKWLQYRDESCKAIGELYKGGSIRPSAEIRCQIELTRSRMRDLDSLYNTVLRH